MRHLLLLIVVLLSWGGSAQAAVILNEVAWMGTEESYLCEWIELYNTGSTEVSLQNWTLQINDGPLKAFQDGEFTSLSIPAGGYVVVERLVASCPDPVPSANDGKLAFGSIPNTNATIRLWQDIEGTTLADQLASGEDWSEIGGDNDSKETAQYTAERGWVTGAGTPGQANISAAAAHSVESTESEEESEKQTTQTASDRASRSAETVTTLTLAEQSAALDPLELTISYPKTVYAGQPVTFTAEPAGRGLGVRNSLRYDWNLGDMTVATGPEVAHVYEFPGEYIVSIQAEYFEYSATAEQTVVVLPVSLSMNISKDGDLHIHNTAPYEVDVSGYQLTTVPPLTFPDRSYITARGTIIIPNAKLGTHAGALFLHNRDGAMVSETEPYTGSVHANLPPSSPTPPLAAEQPVTSDTEIIHTPTTPATTTARAAGMGVTPVAQAAHTADASPIDTAAWRWYLLLGALISIGIISIVVSAPKRSVSRSDGFVE